MSDGRLLAGERLLPPQLFAAAVAFMIGLHLIEPGLRLLESPWTWLGVLPAGIGLALNIWADRLFKYRGTTVKPFQASTMLVSEGPFRLSRNPMYLGMLLALIGLGLVLGSASPLVIVVFFAVILDQRFIRAEEAKMEAEFGEQYRDYSRRVRRWI